MSDTDDRLERIRAARLNAQEVEEAAIAIAEDLQQDRELAKAVALQLLKTLLDAAV